MPHVPLRVHIVPMGFEEDRVTMPAIGMKAELVVVLANLASADKAGRFRASVQARLRSSGIPIEVVRAPIFSVGETLSTFLRVIREHREDQVYVNISAGSKIQAIAGLLAAMIVRSEGIPVRVYYVEPEKYTDDPPETPISRGLRQILEIPALTLPTPNPTLTRALHLLAERPHSKWELATTLAAEGVLDKAKIGTNGRARDERARVSLQASVDARVIQPLLELGYASVSKQGRKVVVTLSRQGRDACMLLVTG